MMLVLACTGPSSIHGTGLFAAEPIKRGTVIWRYEPGVDLTVAPDHVPPLSALHRAEFLNYAYLDRRSGLYVLCGDDARYMNHSDDPAVVSDYTRDQFGESVAIRDIAKGEEITCDYRDFDAEYHLKLAGGFDHNRRLAPHRRLAPWTHPHMAVRSVRDHGHGVFATADIPKGTVLAVLGGLTMTGSEWQKLSEPDKRHSLQVDEDLFLAPTLPRTAGDYLNHSCDPNLGVAGHVALVSLRPVKAGEELCFDYAMTDGSAYDEFTCACGTPYCRGSITGMDWALPELRDRYRGFFSTYLTRRIEILDREANRVAELVRDTGEPERESVFDAEGELAVQFST